MSEETKQKISKTKKGNSPNVMKGKRHSEESRRNMSLAHIGIKLSDYHARRISESLKGKKKTEEWKANISKARLVSDKCKNKKWMNKNGKTTTVNID